MLYILEEFVTKGKLNYKVPSNLLCADDIHLMGRNAKELQDIGLYRDVWIAAIASSRKSLATQTAAICVRFHGRRVRHEYVTMHITFLTRKSALIYRRVYVRESPASLSIANGVVAIRAYSKKLRNRPHLCASWTLLKPVTKLNIRFYSVRSSAMGT